MFTKGIRTLPTVLAAGLFLSGCQSIGNLRSAIFDDTGLSDNISKFTPGHHQMIAQNLVDALSELPETAPLTTTIQIASPDTPFGEMLVETLASAGYGQQLVEGDIGLNLLRYLVENAETETGYRTRYKVEIGETSVERDYQLDNGRLLPASGLRVSGSDASSLTLNDGMFSPSPGQSIDSSVITMTTEAPVIRQLEQDSSEPNSDVLKDRMKVAQIHVMNEDAKENYHERKSSKYSTLFQDYEEIRKDILVFPNDSLRLGNKNKSIVVEIANSFNPMTEVISVVGCSHGKTDLANGNRYLAIGRASRVREALVMAGVEGASIYDEGCWDGAHFDEVMPRRGVVLSVKRARL